MSAHCNKCGYDLSLDLDCAHCAAVARAKRAEAERDTAQASEARLREAITEHLNQPLRTCAGEGLRYALASTPNPEEVDQWSIGTGPAPDPTPEPEEGREWTLARLNGDGHLTKWDVIEDEELHRAVLSDPLWEVVTVREAAPTDPTTEEGDR